MVLWKSNIEAAFPICRLFAFLVKHFLLLWNKYRIFHWGTKHALALYTFGTNNANAASATQFPTNPNSRIYERKKTAREQQRMY
jgi:hypothetical protein